jgi:hypothetical protein
MVMPGMFICCAFTDAETVPSASALAAVNNIVFSECLRKGGGALNAPPPR